MSLNMTLRGIGTGGISGWRRWKAARLSRRYLGDFWRWWSGELRPLMPVGLRALLFDERARERIEPGIDGFLISHAEGEDGPSRFVPFDDDGSEGRALEAAERILVLPRDHVLFRRAVLPLAAEENLREVLAFEMDRLTPFTADRVYYDARIIHRDAAARLLTLELLVAPRCEVDPHLDRLSAMKLTPGRVTAENREGCEPMAFNLLVGSAGVWRGVTRVNLVLAVLAVLLLGIAATLPLADQQRRLNELEPQLSRSIAAAAEARQLEHQVNRLVAGSSYLVDQKRGSLSVLATLNALTTVLPGDTWVERLDVEGRSVRLQGVSGSAEALIGLLERSAAFEQVRFESPVVRHDRQAVDRFHIAAQMSAGEAPGASEDD